MSLMFYTIYYVNSMLDLIISLIIINNSVSSSLYIYISIVLVNYNYN